MYSEKVAETIHVCLCLLWLYKAKKFSVIQKLIKIRIKFFSWNWWIEDTSYMYNTDYDYSIIEKSVYKLSHDNQDLFLIVS